MLPDSQKNVLEEGSKSGASSSSHAHGLPSAQKFDRVSAERLAPGYDLFFRLSAGEDKSVARKRQVNAQWDADLNHAHRKAYAERAGRGGGI